MPKDRSHTFPTRPFAAGAFAFVVITASTDDRDLVHQLFSDLPEPASARTTLSLLRDPRGGRWTVRSASGSEMYAESLDGAIEHLMSSVNLAALDAEPEHLHLHAAAAVKGGRAVIVAASRNTGKTTTIAQLVARGWSYVTDESVRLGPAEGIISGFQKPLSIKPGGRNLVAEFEPWMIPSVLDVEGDSAKWSSHFVPVGSGGGTLASGGSVGLIVLLRRPTDVAGAGGARSRLLHPADAVVALMQETLDAERYGATAVALAKLAGSTACYEVTTGTPPETADEIEALFALRPPEPLEVGVFPPSPAFSIGVISVAVGQRAVVHDQTSGHIFALDEGATQVWRQLGGSGRLDLDLGGPVIAPFVAQLRSLGVLASER